MIADKVIITGFSRGLGKSVADSLPIDKVFGISRTISRDCAYEHFLVDISKYSRVIEVFDNHFEFFENKKIALVLCAGTLGTAGGILGSSLNDWDNTIKTNLLGNLAVIKSVIPIMIKTGYGRIVFISGGGAAYAFPKFSGYSLSKVAIVREVENLAEELRDKIEDFSIVALAPGAMETDMLKRVREAGAEVKTTVDISEPVQFINNFLSMEKNKAHKLSGKFIHVRDKLEEKLFKDKWLLRRIE